MKRSNNKRPEMRNAPLAATGEALNAKYPTKGNYEMNNTTALTFGNTTFDVVQRDGQQWLQSVDIANALGYKDDSSIRRIYDRNYDEFSPEMTQTVKLTVSNENKELQYKTVRIFSLRGAHLLSMFARTTVAKAFRKWVLDILDQYVNEGVAVNPNYRKAETRKALPNGLTIEQQEVVKAHHRTLVLAAPKDKQARLAIRLWSSVKSKFGVSYKEVPPDDFAEVISLMSREAVFGEYLPKETAELTVSISANDAHNLYCLLSIIEIVKPVHDEVYRALSILHSPLAGRMKSAYVEPYATAKVLHRVKLSCEPFYRKSVDIIPIL
ncbi:hypothetical protein LIN78_12140 [Leeia sp. TBRC 13508]|uniref:Bro-N domain-containing protein n=1 Tax=Leeia speluncae TaxID=2884804 RepID=A0ABS8D7V6_9NEIS|nr:BRO family protein [Leeia speluncae]MCB6184295.1 hypothetical protein [Leeia speluncae]